MTSPLIAALEGIPRVELGAFPTPLQRLANWEAFLNYRGIYIKRDDLGGLGPGGNKLRSLEYLLGEAVRQKRDTVIASGPGQSNLCTLTAASCARLGLGCVLVHNCVRPASYGGNLLLNRLLGAESHFIGDVSVEERRAYENKLRDDPARWENPPYIIRNGGSSGLGALGYAAAVLEIYRQCAAGGPEPGTIFAPGGNGGVAAGLIYGNALLGRPFRLVIISVEDPRASLREHILAILAEAEKLTGTPFPGNLDDACEINDDYRGEGWARNTPESEAAVQDFPKREGIFIEHIYTGKVVAGMEDYIRRGKTEGPLCYLHTGGFASLFSQFDPAKPPPAAGSSF